MDYDGLNSVKYKIIKIIRRKLYTKYLVYYNETELLHENFKKNN